MVTESQSEAERRPETPGASDAISYIRFGMDLATRADIQELRGEFNQRFDAVDERFEAVNERLDSNNERLDATNARIDANSEQIAGLAAEVASLRATVKTVGWVVGTLVGVASVVFVSIQVFG